MKKVYWGNSRIRLETEGGAGSIVHREGESFYRIGNYHVMPPFLMSLVSGSEHWMFLSSSGGLTCGRRNPDNALFPYDTDDKIHDSCAMTGPMTALLVEDEGKTRFWAPFAKGLSAYALERNLYKNLPGNRVVFEEINHDLALVFYYSWSVGERFGFIKQSGICNLADSERQIELLDGLRNLLPYGVTQQAQMERSPLLDAYKQAESVTDATAAIYSLSSILTDRAEPCEALMATVAWSLGLDRSKVLLSEDQVEAFSSGVPVVEERQSRGKRGAFFVQSSVSIAPASEKNWYIVADINQGPSKLAALLGQIRRGVTPDDIETDIGEGAKRLLQLVGRADGFQSSSDGKETARHFSNTMFNIMRGGTFYDEYDFPRDDFLDFVETWNLPLRERFSALLDVQGDPLTLSSVRSAAESSGDPHLERLALEYLPLTFSRRHGDPSRPWNRFSIDIRNPDGSDKLYFQGNWRDIFQNWEALALSYPEFIESFIAKFVNASTADGYNPYRITRDGIDWEVLDPDDPWSNIGYWGDHQVNYLLKLLELSINYHPGKMERLLSRDLFVYANVPYRIKAYEALVRDPHDTVVYDDAEAQAIARRVEKLGSDGKLLALADDSIYRVNLLEKLLVPVLSKLGNFVPGGGIWMNTQRPEWNDANNALVGYGLSMVTLCYLRRYLKLFTRVLSQQPAVSYPVSCEVVEFFTGIGDVLQRRESMLDGPVGSGERRSFVDELGELGERYRESVYPGFSGEKSPIDTSGLQDFIERALRFIDHSLAANRRPDGLFHSYNLVHFEGEACRVEHLYEMLEGQVAVLSSGYLGPQESLELLSNLKSSSMYRADQNSYLLYPDKEQVHFLDRNVIDRSIIEGSPWIRNELHSGRSDYVEQDADGLVHFNAGFRNAAELAAALKTDPDISEAEAAGICDAYEAVFRHRQFTGRSGSMFKYEGLGSIYWHMVSKLLLATAEVIMAASQDGADEDLIGSLTGHFDEIKVGLGIHKTPAEYGAFTTDPYSHTPGFIGVQQPGMTGQVKEDVITRFFELGVKVSGGRIEFAPILLKRGEFLTSPQARSGTGELEELDAGRLAFSVCAVPVTYRLARKPAITVFDDNGGSEVISGRLLDHARSRSIFQRDGRVRKILVDLSADDLR
jgi:hypothetical protein